jgi:hypothetical protein
MLFLIPVSLIPVVVSYIYEFRGLAFLPPQADTIPISLEVAFHIIIVIIIIIIVYIY